MPIIVGPDGRATKVSPSEYVSVRESISDVARQVEDLNWLNLSTDRPSLDLVYDDRKRLLQRIRLYRRRSPLAKTAAGLLQHYVLGKGISLKANNRRTVAPIVDEFWENPVNQAVFTSHQAQKEALDALFTDGDLFTALFPDTKAGTVEIGMLDAMFVEDIITDPDNARVARWYKVRKPGGKFNFATGAYEADISTDFTYYRDWRNEDPAGGKGAPPKRLLEDGLIYHARINKRGKFGESDLAAAVDWLKAHKDFMEDRATLNRAAAQVAWKKKRKGGPNDIATEVARLQSTLIGNTTRYESNPPPASGSTIVENDGSTLEWVDTNTGGVAAGADERILRMMAGSGMGGIPNHYFGDEANANLATATAMELPLLKAYEDWQKLWGDIVSDIIGFVLDTAHKAGRIGDRDESSRYAERVTTPRGVLNTAQAVPSGGAAAGAAQMNPSANTSPSTLREAATAPRDPALALTLMAKTEPVSVGQDQTDSSGAVDWFVDVDFPPILSKKVDEHMNAIKVFYELLPAGNIESQKLVVEQALNLLGENNVDEVMERLFPADATAQELQANSALPDQNALTDALTSALARAGGKEPAVGPDGAPVQRATMTESLAEYRVRRVLRAARDASDALAAVGS